MSAASPFPLHFKNVLSGEKERPPDAVPSENFLRSRSTWVWLALLIVGYLALNTVILLHTVHDPDLALKMESKDSKQYVEIAHDFAKGDFSMSYAKDMPHRQPLYPLALTPVVKIWGDDLPKLGAVNIVVGLALLVGLYLGLLSIFHRYSVAVLSTAAFIGNPFMIDKISCRLMTEPLHALLLTGLLLLFIRYVQQGKLSQLLGISAAAAADYLVKTNGLFVAGATFGVLVVHEAWRLFKRPADATESRLAFVRRKVIAYLAAALVFIVVAAPSWVPRYRYFHDPIYHGYLSNFLWVDSYEQGHTGQARTDFSWKDYSSSHDLHSVMSRWATGFYHVYYDIPRHTEHVRILYFFAIVGLAATCFQRRWDFCLLAGCLFIQMLPVVWTSLSNPGPRVPYGTMFPFELVFAALAVNWLASLIEAWRSKYFAGGLTTKPSSQAS